MNQDVEAAVDPVIALFEHRTGLLVDEWGVWDRMVPEEEKRYGRLWQQITMRSAAAAALRGAGWGELGALIPG